MQLGATKERHNHRNGWCDPDPTEGDLPSAPADMRPELMRIAEQPTHRSSIERVSWDETLSPTSDLPSESLDQSRTRRLIGNMPPPIQICVSADWGARKGLDSLNTLLSDSRDGARKGYSIVIRRFTIADFCYLMKNGFPVNSILWQNNAKLADRTITI